MDKKISSQERFFIAGGSGMVGGAVFKTLKDKGYGMQKFGGDILNPTKDKLNLLNKND